MGLVNSLGSRREADAVPALKTVALAGDAAVSSAAIIALGRIGTPDAGAALQSLPADKPRRDVVDALAVAADHLAADGRVAAAQAVYSSLLADGTPYFGRLAGLKGLAATHAPGALDAALAALADKDPTLARAAAKLALIIADPQTVAKLAAACPGTSPLVQPALLETLGARGDAAAMPAITAAFASTDRDVRAAAIRAAGLLGGAEAVKVLVPVLVKGGADAAVAREVLGRVKGKEASAAVADLAANAEPAVRTALMAILADRELKSAVPLLLAAAADPTPKLAVEAWKALARLAGPESYPDLVKLYLAATDDAVRDAGQTTLVVVARKVGDRDKALQPLLDAYAGAGKALKVSLLGLFASVGGDAALTVLTKAAADPDADLKRAAVDGLANAWDDARPVDTLLDVAQNDPNAGLKTLAFRGALRLIGIDERLKPADKVAKLAAALGIADAQGKRNVLNVLRNCRVSAAVDLAVKCLDDPQLSFDAQRTIVDLSAPQKRDGQNLPAVRGAAMQAALDKVQEARGTALPKPWHSRDIGDVGSPGSATGTPAGFAIKACGNDIWDQRDAFHFLSQPWTGDGSIVVRVADLEQADPWTKAGVMFREGLNPDAPHVMICVTPGQGISFQWRPEAGAACELKKPDGGFKAPYYLKLSRTGDVFTGAMSSDGKNWETVASQTVKLKDVEVGLAVTSHNAGQAVNAAFDNVKVEKAP